MTAGGIDLDALATSMQHLNAMIEGDGASIRLLAVDHELNRVRLELDLSAVECLDCVLPHEILADIATEHVRKAVGAGTVVELADSRVAS